MLPDDPALTRGPSLLSRPRRRARPSRPYLSDLDPAWLSVRMEPLPHVTGALRPGSAGLRPSVRPSVSRFRALLFLLLLLYRLIVLPRKRGAAVQPLFVFIPPVLL